MRFNSVNKELLLVNYDAVLNGLYLGCDELLKLAESFCDSVSHCVNLVLLSDVERVINRIDSRLDCIPADLVAQDFEIVQNPCLTLVGRFRL